MRMWWTEGGPRERMLEGILRVGAAACFIGHGAFGVIGKEGWLPYFAVAGVPESWAWALMPVVGGVDIFMGVAALVAPAPVVLVYMVVWAAWTALLRPLAGESVFETLERGGNYGVPLALLVATGFRIGRARLRDWFRPAGVRPMDDATRRRVQWVLRGTIALLLVGHGGLAVGGKPMLAEHMAVVGMPSDMLGAMGWAEIVLGLAIFVRPLVSLLVVAFVWKVGTEALFPVTGAPMWEFIERFGSYTAPLALLALRHAPARAPVGAAAPTVASVGRTAALAILLGLGAAAAAPRAGSAQDRSDDVLRALRAGTLVLACRHARTDRSRGDARRVDYDEPATQRVLSREGRDQARRLGQVLAALDVPIGDVLVSPYARTRDSGDLAFGRSERSDALVYGNRPAQRRERRRLVRARTDGGTRVLMTHQGILYGLFPEIERGSIREGDCVVVAPGGDGRDVLGRFGNDEFEALGRTGPSMPPARTLHTSRTLLPSETTPGPAIIR